MKSILEIYKYTFKYKGVALLVILFNLLYVVFNLISLALFVPFLQIIFTEEREVVLEPIRQEGLISFFKYYADLFDYQMYKLVEADPKQALFFACFSIGLAFFGKTLFRFGR